MSDVLNSADRRKTLLFQKVGIFVDAENIEMSSLKHHEGRTDYKRLIEAVGDREVLRILYYKPVYKDISQTFELFWKALGGEIRRPAKNADSFLIIDAVTMAEKLDVAIIVGGDKDYLPLVWYLKSRGCRVEIWSWPESTSPEVREAADVYFPLTKDFVIPPEETRNPKLRGDTPTRTENTADPSPVKLAPASVPPASSARQESTRASGGRGQERRSGGRGGGRSGNAPRSGASRGENRTNASTESQRSVPPSPNPRSESGDSKGSTGPAKEDGGQPTGSVPRPPRRRS